MNKRTRILVYRFSAMGDVVMLLPVLKGLLESDQNLEIYFLTREFLFPVFKGIDRLHLVAADLKGEHRGLAGLFRLSKMLKREIQPDQVFDLHQVLRTHILNFLFRFYGTKVYSFNKGRKAKKNAVKQKSRQPLLSTIDRYADVFHLAGYSFQPALPPLFPPTNKKEVLSRLKMTPSSDSSDRLLLVGIAPFAKHPQKIWGKDKIYELLNALSKIEGLQVVLFGGGTDELRIMKTLQEQFDNTLLACDYLNLAGEISLLPHLHVMLSMDSANMHLAAMAGIPVVSVWGATHPSLGFAPYQQPIANCIQYDGDLLNCRPCSVFGNKECIYQDIRCMKYVTVEQVFDRIISFLPENRTH